MYGALPEPDATEETQMSMFTNDPRLAIATAKRNEAQAAFNKCPTSAELAKQYQNACYDYWNVVDTIRSERAAKRNA